MNEQGSPRDIAVVKVVKTINSCREPEHITTASRMIDQFERLFGTDTPLRRWLLLQEFDVTHFYSRRV